MIGWWICAKGIFWREMQVALKPGANRHQTNIDLPQSLFDVLEDVAVPGVTGEIHAITIPFKQPAAPQGAIGTVHGTARPMIGRNEINAEIPNGILGIPIHPGYPGIT